MPRTLPDEPLIPALATPSFATDASPKKDVLAGPLGLRAGWGILIFFVLAIALGFALFMGLFKVTGQLAAFQHESQQTRVATMQAKAQHQPVPVQVATLSTTSLSEIAETGAVLLTALGLGLVEKRRFGVYGLGLRHVRDLLPGAGVGMVAIAALVGCLWSTHLLVFDRLLLNGGAAARYGLAWLLVFFLVGIFEEFLFRGYIQFTLMRGLLGLGARISVARARAVAFWLAALIWSSLFSLSHLGNAGEDTFGLVMVFVAGMLFSYALWRTGSLWWGIGFHMTWDWGQSFLFGVPDSGSLSAGRLFLTHATGRTWLSGAGTGPEGSVLVLPVLALVAVVIRLTPAKAQPPVEPEKFPLRREAIPAGTIS